MSGNLPDACLRSRSIGLSPPRLHYGRAANYGSIIISCACHRRSRWQSGFRRMGLIARPFGVLAHLQSQLKVPPMAQGTYPVDDIQFSKRIGEKVPSLSLLELFSCFGPNFFCRQKNRHDFTYHGGRYFGLYLAIILYCCGKKSSNIQIIQIFLQKVHQIFGAIFHN